MHKEADGIAWICKICSKWQSIQFGQHDCIKLNRFAGVTDNGYICDKLINTTEKNNRFTNKPVSLHTLSKL